MGKGQELLDAAREGDRRTVEKILGQINKRSGPFPSLRRGAGVNVQDDNGYTPLHHACLRGHKDIVRLLLSVDASPCITDKKGATPLHLAAWKGDSDVVSMLLSHNNPPVNIDQLTSDQESAVLIAAQFGNVDVVAQLLAKGADVTIRNIKNETALDLAAQYGRLETVKHLLRARPQLVEEYRHHMYKPSTPLHRASKNGHKEVVATLISAGIDPNVKTSNGTALHEAAYYGKASVVKVLLAKGADPNARDRLGKTVYDVLNDYPEEATKNIRRILRDYEKTNGYDSEEDLPPFPVNDYSPTGYPSSGIMNTHETPSFPNNLSLSPSSSSITKTSQSFVKKLACKLGIKTKCSSAPNIFNTSESDVLIRKYEQNKSNSNTIITGNSKFFKLLSKKEETGDIVCNDEFDTISLDRLPSLDRATTVNRSNRSCPGFKVSLPNISENAELSDTESTDSIEITELNCNETIIENKISPKPRRIAPLATPEAVNLYPNLNIFEPRNHDSNPRSSDESTTSANAVNDYYESYDLLKSSSVHTVDLIPKPPPRPSVASKNIVRGTVYENVIIENNVVKPTPAARMRPAPPPPTQVTKENPIENEKSQIKAIPDVPKRTVVIADKENCNISSSISTSSLSSDSSLEDESNLEDILLSKKSTSFKHRTKLSINKTNLERSQSIASYRSDITEASAIENVDCSNDPNEKSMTGTLPNKKSQEAIKTKKLFRHKTFTDIKADRNSLKDLKWNDQFLKETLASYHIRGTGHCIYKAPTVQEFINIFNQEVLYEDVETMHDTKNKRESYFETAICFCKPKPKFHNSADDLLDMPSNEEKVTIDLDALQNRKEIMATTFQCFCDGKDELCKFHLKNRQNSSNLVVKFSAINKSISTPNITLISTFPTPKSPGLPKNKSVPDYLEDPSSITNYENLQLREKEKLKQTNSVTSYTSQISTSSSVSQQYSVKDISDAISDSTLTSNSSLQRECQRQSNSSSHTFWSLNSSDSNVTIRSNLSYKSCLEDISSDDDETLHCDSDSDADTIKSDISESKRPWVSSDSFRFGNRKASNPINVIKESDEISESGGSLVASLERGSPVVGCSGSVRRRWEDAEGTSEGDALSVSSAASSCAAHHFAHHHEYNKVSPTPPKKPPRRNLSVSPTHANSPSSGSYSYDLRTHARSQDDLDDLQGPKQHLRHGHSIDQYVDSKLSYSEYEENHNLKAPVPHPRPSIKPRVQPIAITTMYENVCIKEQNPRRKLKRNSFGQSEDKREKSSLESLLDESPSDYERCNDGSKVDIPLSPSHYNQPPTPDHPPPSAKIAENSIHERIRPLSQEYKRRSALRDSYTEVEINLLRVASAASVASGATDRSGNTDCVEEFVCDVPFAGLFKGSTTTLDGIGLRPMPAERPKTLRKLKSVYDTSPTEAPTAHYQHTTSNGQDRSNGIDEEVRRRSGTTSSNQSTDKSLSILSPFDEQEEWAKISEIMASFGSKLVRESVFVSELEQEFTSRLGLSCSESSLSPSVSSNLGLWLAGFGLHDYESLFLDSGFDDLDFINGVLEESDLKEMGVEEADRIKILEATRQLPMKITEISNNHNNNSLIHNRPNDTVDHWLKSIHLDNYIETFRKHLYNDMDRVRRIWEVELTAVLEIQKLGHRKRILASVSGQNNGPSTKIEDINADLNNLKNNIKQLKEEIKEKMPHSEHLKSVPPPVVPHLAPGGETLKRSKKNRPAPQPPRPSDLEIRAPSELLVGVPGALKTQWKHQPFVLVTGAVTYKANYLGSTVVKELRGTESTKKSIQKLKKNNREPRDSPDIILSISYRGVKFLNTSTLELICEHEIRNIHCACQDADDLTHFAYITKDHTTKSHYCHVFCVTTMDQATEVILTLGEAFEVAYQMALREQSIRPKVPYGSQPQTKTPTHDPTTSSHKEKVNINHGRSHSITEIKLNGHQLKIAPIPSSLSNEDFQSVRGSDSSRSPLGLLKAPIASTEEL